MTDEPVSNYQVVIKVRDGVSAGVMVRTSFPDKHRFDDWYGRSMQDGTGRKLREVYAVVAEGVTEDEAFSLVSSPENTEATIRAAERLVR